MPAPLDARGIRGIVFDLDGTLIDSYGAITESLNAALAALGFPTLAESRVRGLVGRGLETLMQRAMGLADARDPNITKGIGHFRERYDEICVRKTTLLPAVEPTLAELGRRGYLMSVATNKPSYFARRLLDSLGIGPYMRTVLGPDLVTHHKPHPAMVNEALAAMSVRPDEAVYVGDMEVDVETARAAGLPVIVVATGSSSSTELATAGADLVLEEFPLLLDVLVTR